MTILPERSVEVFVRGSLETFTPEPLVEMLRVNGYETTIGPGRVGTKPKAVAYPAHEAARMREMLEAAQHLWGNPNEMVITVIPNWLR